MSAIVTITCYGKTEKMNRDKAIAFYTEGILYSDGSERDRYVSIVTGLQCGKTVVDDNWEWNE